MTKQTRNCGPRQDLTGQTFNYLTPLYYIKGGKWHCKCKCGNELDVDTRNLKNGHTKSCGCFQKEQASKNTINMLNYEDDNIKVLKYVGSDNQQVAKWECLCKHCGKTFITRGSNIRNGDTRSCGCIKSFNEQLITKLFLENNIEFATQYTFSDLKSAGDRPLRFDFAVFKNNKLSHLIEYNGKQHYEKPLNTWGDNFENQIINDQKKIDYCKEHNIELRIIKYDQNYSLKDLI